MHQPVSPNPTADAKLPYSQGMVARGEMRTLYIAGQVGTDANGVVAPDFEAQTRQAWTNLLAVLDAANMKVTDLIKITAFLTDPADYAAYGSLRTQFLAGAKPTSTLLVVKALARPEWKFEIEGVAMTAA
ncbi:MAG: RidA family protein [Rhodopseudomonas sp.]|nr:RidA family protein [Rhodopseudomonas sp.]